MDLPQREPCNVGDRAELAQSNRDALARFEHTMRNRHGENWALINLRDDPPGDALSDDARG